jgi:hypothetical protein
LPQADDLITQTQPVRLKSVQKLSQGLRIKGDPKLGSLLTPYHASSMTWQDLYRFWLPGLIAIAAPLLYGRWLAQKTLTSYGPIAAGNWSIAWFWLSFTALLTFLGLVCIRLLATHYEIVVFERGLRIHIHPFTTTTLRWSQISGVSDGQVQERFLGIPIRTYIDIVIYPNLGKAIHITNQISEPTRFINQVKEIINPLLLPELKQAYTAGKWLHFGKLTLNNQGMILEKQKITWEQVSFLGIKRGFLVVERRKGKRFTLPITKISNVELLLQIFLWRTQT